MDERHELWRETIASKANPPYKGFVCQQHFTTADFTNEKKIRLKKNAVPNVFNEEHDQNNDYTTELLDSMDPIATIDTDVQQKFASTEANYKELCEQFMKEKASWNVKEQKLNHRMYELKNKCDEQKQHIKFLNQKLQREVKHKESLKALLEELHAGKLLDKKNLETLQASTSIYHFVNLIFFHE